MSKVHLAILWHMHQPQYRDPATGKYLLPWTRLHALKDYWGMVKILEEYPGVHATFNMVPLLAEQIEEYASGSFQEPWFDIATAPADSLTGAQKREALERGFQVNENFLNRWPRYGELHALWQSGGTETCVAHWSAREWRDLQVLSQLSWMDEEYIAKDPAVNKISAKGKNFTEAEKATLRDKQMELLAAVLPEYRLAASRGQIEISTTPYYHPILPLLCNSDIAQVSNPHSPLPRPAFRHKEDARDQLGRAKQFHERVFGATPAGLWPSEGSVSDEALEVAMELGFRWFATDEGVLGRTRNIGFWRDASGYPENGPQLYKPWVLKRSGMQMTGFFRDHYLSDLVGFVYSRMNPQEAAENLHRRIRAIGERDPAGRPATVSLILDGENAWEYYPGNGREFLRQFYNRIEGDPDLRALTMSEAMAAASDAPAMEGIFPASWINANFDVWIGHAEDVRAWDLLRDARDAFEEARQLAGTGHGPSPEQLARSYNAVLAAEGSDWTWWYGPEHASANDAEFDALYRKHLTEIYTALGQQAPNTLAHPIKHPPDRARRYPPTSYLNVRVDGRETTYFEWLGAGLYATQGKSGTMHGRSQVFSDLHYGFGPDHLFVRVDPVPEAIGEMQEFQIRLTIWGAKETRITLTAEKGKFGRPVVERAGMCILQPEKFVACAYGKILEVSVARALFELQGRKEMLLSAALWRGGLPVDVLPLEGLLNIALGEENFAWPLEESGESKVDSPTLQSRS